MPSNSKSSKAANSIKALIILVVLTMLGSSYLPAALLLFIYPALMLAMIFLLPVFHAHRKTPDYSFFGNLCIAAILNIAIYLVAPLIFHLGIASFAVIGFLYIFAAMAAERVMGSDIDATLMTIIFLVISRALIPGFIMAAILLDITRNRMPGWIRGVIAAVVWAGLSFGFSMSYGFEFSLALVYAAMAGLVAGSIFSLFHLDDEKHIDRLLKKW